MSQHTHHLSDDTSDRLYTPEELASYAAAEGRPGRPAGHDPPRPAQRPAQRPAPRGRAHRDPAAAGAARPGRAAGDPPAPGDAGRRPGFGPAFRAALRAAERSAAWPPGPAVGVRPLRPPHLPPRAWLRAAPLHDRDRLPRAPRRCGGARPCHVGLARAGPPLERRLDHAADGAGRACLRAGPGADPEGLRRPGHHRLHQPEGRRRQDHRRPGRRLHVRHRPRRWRGRVGQQRDARHPRHPRVAQLAHQDDQGAAGRPRQVRRRLPVADRRPRVLRPLSGGRALRRTRLRREPQRHRPDPRRRLQLHPPAARRASTGSSSWTRGTTCAPRTGWPRPTPPTCWW